MEGMPPVRTISGWAVKFEDFSQKCAHARLQQAHVIVEDMARILEKVEKGELSSDQGRVILSGKQWIASRKNPKAYGDKMTLAGDAENPLFNLGKRLDDMRQRQQALEASPSPVMIDITPLQPAIGKPGDDLC